MKRSKMYDALTELDPQYIEKAYPKKRRVATRTAVAVFLCAAILISVAAGIALNRNGGAPATGDIATEPTVSIPDYDGGGEIINLSASVSAELKEGKTADEEFIGAVSNFSAELLKAQLAEGENTLLSPLSAMYALSMTANGAQGQTLEQMEQVLGGELSIEELNEYLRGLYARLLTEDSGITTANSIWIRDIFSPAVSPEFLEKNSHYYNADVYTAPFNNDTVKAVNQWAFDNTDGMVEEIIDGIDPGSMMLLLNSLLFESEWEEKIEESYNGKFTSSDGTGQDVIIMKDHAEYYISDLNSQGYIKKLNNGCSFFAILPGANMTADGYARTLTGEKLYDMLNGAQNEMVKYHIPAFSTYVENDLTDALTDMGMADAFSATTAQFSGISADEGNIYVDTVKQNARIDVTMDGVKAAAVTVVSTKIEADIIIELYFNRPFVYGIMTEDGIPLFIGVQNEI